MRFAVPENQSVSWAVYWPSVQRKAGVSHNATQPFIDKIMRGFDAGEPIWMGALTLKQYVDCSRGYGREKTPLQIARRVVRA